jgi:succinate dehydrogenase / fumarate reductase membrane anchor subunit
MATTSPTPPPSIAPPRSRTVRTRGGNTEMYGWIFMRVSGVLLVFLVLGHLFVNLMVGEGINAIDFGFVASKWASPFWQVYDLLMLWLAMIHGANGLRTIINDYAERDGTRFWLKVALVATTFLIIAVGTTTIFTFDPCIDPETALEFCADLP